MSLFDKLKGLLGGSKRGAGRAADPEPESDFDSEGPEQKRRTTRGSDELLEAAARALFTAGEAAGAVRLLSDMILFAQHVETSLPCLCRRCLKPEPSEVTVEGESFVRDFVIVRHRVLFFWAPSELAKDSTSLRASMRSALRERLKELAKDEPPTERTNPFTGEPIVMPAKSERAVINPLSGKRVL